MVFIYTVETWRESCLLDILCIASYSSSFMFLKCCGKSNLLVGFLNIASYVF
jgi:hypothetical protein